MANDSRIKALEDTWRVLLVKGSSKDAKRLWADLEAEVPAGDCPRCEVTVNPRFLKNHQRGDWCFVSAVKRRAKAIGLAPARPLDRLAMERAGVPFTRAPTGKTVSFSRNTLQYSLFTLPAVLAVIKRTKPGSARHDALVEFMANRFKKELLRLAPAARRATGKATAKA